MSTSRQFLLLERFQKTNKKTSALQVKQWDFLLMVSFFIFIDIIDLGKLVTGIE